ncbi:MAG: alpha/beta fold hydrolase [Defluviicoccus sp.]|nr:alpha/beta fold hydrolase [Defluviicoccus sp.]MDE0276051.1 alpha/beta fold hydrolase [Defluviicoccus sp.]
MIVEANGIRFNCVISGRQGAPWLTFSNALATDLTMWDEQARAFARDYRMLRYDTRGHGGSTAVNGPYSLDMLADDVVAIWDAIGVDRSHVVGLSIGAMTAVGLALRHAERLDRVVVANARPDNPPELRGARERRIAAIRREGMSALAEPTVERWCSGAFLASQPDAAKKLVSMVAGTSAAGYAGSVHALLGLDYRDRLGGIRVPALFVAGGRDAGVPPEAMREMHRAVRGSQFVELPRAGHISNVECPAEFNRAVGEFLSARSDGR